MDESDTSKVRSAPKRPREQKVSERIRIKFSMLGKVLVKNVAKNPINVNEYPANIDKKQGMCYF
ncbi:MAG: hypothetical protein QGF59_07570, partial [Pirellulaceae bacterium]|nr:hypothetical protein [Pirellulaceae bacterium]